MHVAVMIDLLPALVTVIFIRLSICPFLNAIIFCVALGGGLADWCIT